MPHFRGSLGAPWGYGFKLKKYCPPPPPARRAPEGQNYPPSLDPSKVEMTDKVKSLPAFDITGKLAALTFENPEFWTSHEAEWTKAWNRIAKGA